MTKLIGANCSLRKKTSTSRRKAYEHWDAGIQRTDYELGSQKESASCCRKVVCSTISVRWEPPQIHRLQASSREWEIQEKKLIRSGDWTQIESPNGAAPIPDSQVSPCPPQLIPSPKTRYSHVPPRGTQLHHFSPGYTPGTHKYCAHARTDLLCPCHQFSSRAPGIRAILCSGEASKTDPTEKGQTVCPRTDGLASNRCRALADKSDARALLLALTSSLQSRSSGFPPPTNG